ncbi:hypothetical protein [Streptomyces sp. TRM68367]|uniref:hypothetical protein n=1 Tax=Streptomyces sp. TRM68367 TaxID=2758415 RepID=UPI0037DC678E
MLGVLRSEHPETAEPLDGTGTAPHTPQPTLDRLDARNVLRHAPGADARVALTYAADGLHVLVVNSRPTRPAPPTGSGHGLLGVRERVAMLDGTLSAGSSPDGGYRLTAFLPTATDPTGPAPDRTRGRAGRRGGAGRGGR